MKVVKEGLRPRLPERLSEEAHASLVKMWHIDPLQRPTMSEIVLTLSQALLSSGEDDGVSAADGSPPDGGDGEGSGTAAEDSTGEAGASGGGRKSNEPSIDEEKRDGQTSEYEAVDNDQVSGDCTLRISLVRSS